MAVPDLNARIRNALCPSHVELFGFDARTAETYSRRRRLFRTNDRKLHGPVIPRIDFIADLDLNL